MLKTIAVKTKVLKEELMCILRKMTTFILCRIGSKVVCQVFLKLVTLEVCVVCVHFLDVVFTAITIMVAHSRLGQMFR